MKNYVLPLLVFVFALGLITRERYWNVKREPGVLCTAEIVFCQHDDDADAVMRDIERKSGGLGPPAGTLWCRCVWGYTKPEWPQ